jgi:hypothetical protein
VAPPPSFRKTNPADSLILDLAPGSPTLSSGDEYAEMLLAQRRAALIQAETHGDAHRSRRRLAARSAAPSVHRVRGLTRHFHIARRARRVRLPGRDASLVASGGARIDAIGASHRRRRRQIGGAGGYPLDRRCRG